LPPRPHQAHRAFNLPALASSPIKAPKKAPQQGRSRQRVDRQDALDAFQPQTCIARPLVEFDPWHALLQQIGSRHDRPPRLEHLGDRQMPDK
jgi:hypothetical protein